MSKPASGLAEYINRRLFFVTVISTVLAAVISAAYTLAEFNVALKPQLLKKFNLVADEVRGDIELAVEVGIPLQRISGMDSYLEGVVEKYPELLYIDVVGPSGSKLYQGGSGLDKSQLKVEFLDQLDTSQSVDLEGLWKALQSLFSGMSSHGEYASLMQLPLGEESRYGQLNIALDGGYITSQLTDVFFDIAIVLVAVLLVAFELVLVLVMFYISGPLQRSEAMLKRQAEGDFAVQQGLAKQGVIGAFIERLNDDSQKLQMRFRRVVNRASGHADGDAIPEFETFYEVEDRKLSEKLRNLADKFHLLNVLRESKGNIIDARIPLFVFAFAEELQKSFMPLYVAEYYQPIPGISKDIVLGLPISVFMFVIAAITPFAGAWVDKFGNRRLFLIGLVPAIAGYLICATAGNSNEIIAGRGITALGYAIITISCQGYIAALLSSDNRAKGMAVFVGVLMTASMCGTALGGIIADRIGYQPVFVLSAMLTVVAGLLAWLMLSTEVGLQGAKKAAVAASPWALLSNGRFVSIVLFCAIPAKIILTGFLYYFVPLYLVTLDASQSEIGRVMMVYALIIIPLGPLASRFADYSGRMVELVVVGTLLSGGVLLLLYTDATIVTVLMTVAFMGVSHAILKAPLIAAALEASEATPGVGKTTVLGLLRTSERVGSVLGPIIVAALIAMFDYGPGMAILGAAIIAIALLTAGVLLGRKAPVEEKNG